MRHDLFKQHLQDGESVAEGEKYIKMLFLSSRHLCGAV